MLSGSLAIFPMVSSDGVAPSTPRDLVEALIQHAPENGALNSFGDRVYRFVGQHALDVLTPDRVWELYGQLSPRAPTLVHLRRTQVRLDRTLYNAEVARRTDAWRADTGQARPPKRVRQEIKDEVEELLFADATPHHTLMPVLLPAPDRWGQDHILLGSRNADLVDNFEVICLNAGFPLTSLVSTWGDAGRDRVDRSLCADLPFDLTQSSTSEPDLSDLFLWTLFQNSLFQHRTDVPPVIWCANDSPLSLAVGQDVIGGPERVQLSGGCPARSKQLYGALGRGMRITKMGFQVRAEFPGDYAREYQCNMHVDGSFTAVNLTQAMDDPDGPLDLEDSSILEDRNNALQVLMRAATQQVEEYHRWCLEHQDGDFEAFRAWALSW